MPTRVGTHHYESLRAIAGSNKPADLKYTQEKVDAGELAIGLPKCPEGCKIMIDVNRRYWIVDKKMRALTLDEKISLKGQLARYNVAASVLIRLTTASALWFWNRCCAAPITYHSTPKQWHKAKVRK